MISFIRNIRYVSKYESKLLFRSWFFRIFALLSIAILVIYSIQAILHQEIWQVIVIPSNVAYNSLLMLNIGQAVIAIFLASDFLKRDRKLDTSEVFYVRPLSNAEYVFGKIWGNLRIFFILNLMAIGVSIIFTAASRDVPVDWGAYVFYFLIISIPTLVYIIGLSVFLMLIFRNQAITFVMLLGYIGATLFYIKGKFYYLFDYMAYYLPLMKSTIVGFPNMEEILIHRSIYLFAGLTCIFITIPMFGRLPNSSRGSYPWIILSLCALLACAGAGYRHISRILGQNEIRQIYTQVNNKYVHTPKMTVEQYDISVKQNPETFASEVRMRGTALSASPVFTFCLNPGLEIGKIESEGKALDFVRDRQIILINFGREIPAGDTVSLSISYSGKTDNSFCYLDIPEEELNKINSTFMFNIDKQYSFQTANYMLVTPETFWYPRPGTGYSDESPDWQQTYFSRFTLNVTPLSGLIPLSQGEGVENDDGSYSFSPEYPVQAISLAIGNYRQKSCVRDSIRYSIWHIEGNDFFYATALDSIRDTIPALVQNIKENMERQYKLDYPFKRFSIVEVPAQFYCHVHTWSQAQETVQPEMVFFIERGCDQYRMFLPKIIERNMKWGDSSLEESQLIAFQWAINIFTSPIGDVNYTANRGSYNVSMAANRYFTFPQFYNFRYNIFSPEWAVANRLIELYLQGMNTGYEHWERQTNGISNQEKASILLGQQSFSDLLSNPKYLNLMNNITGLKASQLFAVSEINIGVGAFRDSLYSTLKKYTFRNVQFESLLDTLSKISGTDILSGMASWNEPMKLPMYSIGEPEMIRVNNRGVEDFVFKVTVRNHSDYDGIIHVSLTYDDPKANRKVMIPARRSLQMVSVWDSPPANMTINTLISENLPMTVSQPINTNIRQENRKLSEKDEDIILPEDYSGSIPGELIVDNSDSTLFVLTKKTVPGLLPKLLDDSKDTLFKYSGFSSWKAPLQWTESTNGKFYGKQHIRSAYVVRSVQSKGGDQTATWKIPVPSPGQYELYYHMFLDDNIRYSRNYYRNAEYRFKVAYGKELEDAYLSLTKSNGGWERLGVYYFESDTVRVTLSNECKYRYVAADAVKIVKR